jgi:hypothetical protein
MRIWIGIAIAAVFCGVAITVELVLVTPVWGTAGKEFMERAPASAIVNDERAVGRKHTLKVITLEAASKNGVRMNVSVGSCFFHVYGLFHEIYTKEQYTRKEKGGYIFLWQDRNMRYSIRRKQEARAIALSRITHFNQFYQCSLRRISIRNQRSRWGSCSQKGNLNFNYRLLKLPLSLVDYIVVHELCHLREFNHSKRFWDLVGETLPDFRERRAALRKIPL